MTTSSEVSPDRIAGVVALTDPFAARHGGTLRTRGFIQAIEGAGFRVSTLLPTAPAGLAAQRVKAALGTAKRHFLPMPTVWGGRDAQLAADVKNSRSAFLVVSVLSQAQFAASGDTPYWLDFMDVWSDFAAREAAHRDPIARLTALAQSRVLRRYESTVAGSARIVTAAGWADSQRLTALGTDCHWVPTALPDDEFSPVRRRADGPGAPTKVAGFLANFDFWPNMDALTTLLRHWLPALRAEGWQLLVAGHGSDRLADLPADVVCLGPVADLEDYYARIDLTLAPIRLGGGMKVKVVESWARGIPVAGTEVAFEGFSPQQASLFVRVPIENPRFTEFQALQRRAPIDPSGSQLAPFRQSTLSATVRRLVHEGGL